MPKWMEPYRSLFKNTGGNKIERLMNGHTAMQINAPLAFLETSCEAQVEMLEVLHVMGLLTDLSKQRATGDLSEKEAGK